MTTVQMDADFTDVDKMTDRVMINLFKQKVQEKDFPPKGLKGTWSEVSDILVDHFGKMSRVMTQNKDKLQELYLQAIRELEEF